jgi:hypothetical protein
VSVKRPVQAVVLYVLIMQVCAVAAIRNIREYIMPVVQRRTSCTSGSDIMVCDRNANHEVCIHGKCMECTGDCVLCMIEFPVDK